MKFTWHILRSKDEDFVRQAALASGWKEKKVQVRRSIEFGEMWYYLEPYEKDCNCSNLLKPD